MNSVSTFNDSKPHYIMLDALRGVAALMVIWYHIFEGFAFASGGSIDSLNHGYLAVDFFFLLSGFVISYAYDDRWKNGFKMSTFFKRRLIRLHPMIILGSIIGVISFIIQGGTQWNGAPSTFSSIILAMLCGMLLIPAIASHSCYDVRGNGEMFSLNGPSWSLFFEYIGNIFYAVFIRHLNTRQLACLTTLMGIGYAIFATFNMSGYGNIGVGWTLDSTNFGGGMLRMMFPFSLGMLMARNFRPVKIRGAFWICSALLITSFSIPYLNEVNGIHLNGIYETFCVAILFPIILWIGASESNTSNHTSKLYSFLGNISYPVYIIHYPIMYLFYSWLIENKLYTLAETWYVAIPIFITVIILAYLCLNFYDKPIRRYLSKKTL